MQKYRRFRNAAAAAVDFRDGESHIIVTLWRESIGDRFRVGEVLDAGKALETVPGREDLRAAAVELANS